MNCEKIIAVLEAQLEKLQKDGDRLCFTASDLTDINNAIRKTVELIIKLESIGANDKKRKASK